MTRPEPDARRPPRTAALLAILLLGVLAVPPGTADEGAPDDGAGLWGPGGLEPQAASAQWSFRGTLLAAFRVVADAGVFACVHGHLTARLEDGRGVVGTCGGHTEDEDHVAFYADTEEGQWRGTFQGTEARLPVPDEDDPAWNALGITVTAMAAGFGAYAALLTILYLRERRFKHYLVRRLYEETQGRFPYDLPQGHSREIYARILVKGKN